MPSDTSAALPVHDSAQPRVSEERPSREVSTLIHDEQAGAAVGNTLQIRESLCWWRTGSCKETDRAAVEAEVADPDNATAVAFPLRPSEAKTNRWRHFVHSE